MDSAGSPSRAVLPALRRVLRSSTVTTSAESVYVDRRVVRLKAEAQAYDLAYDSLVVATGATHAYFGHEAWRDFAPGLKTLGDALGIRRQVLMAFERAEHTADPSTQRRLLTGRHVAANIRGRSRGNRTRTFRYRNLGDLATIGRGTAVADFGWTTPVGRRGLARLVVRSHLESHWFSQPFRRSHPMGLVLLHLSAERSVDYRPPP